MNNLSWWLVLLSIVIGSLFSSFIPPLQSPDEAAHIARAYLLTKGQIFLTSSPGQGGEGREGKANVSGGMIDKGLAEYLSSFDEFHTSSDRKLSLEDEFSSSSINWAGKKVFFVAPGTGYYLPLAYIPQALALGFAEKVGLSLKWSYRLARFFTLTFSSLVIATAFALFPANAFIVGLLMIPMSVFQFCSASLDAFTTALTILCISLFMRGCDKKFSFPIWMSYLLAGAVLIVVTSRIHLLPLLLLPLFLWIFRNNRMHLWQFVIIAILSLGWITLSIKASFVSRAGSDYSTGQIISYYFQHPVVLFQVFVSTITDNRYIEFYKNSFIGLWFGAEFDEIFYIVICYLLLLLAFFSFSSRTMKEDWRARIILVNLGIYSIFLIFFALLVTWNPVPAKTIEGVQGRYFLGPLILIGYALSGSAGFFTYRWNKIAMLPLMLIGVLVIINFPKILLERYYMPTYSELQEIFKMQPSAPLTAHTPLKISMSNENVGQRQLRKLGIMFGTWARQNPGDAALRLTGPDGAELVRRFSLAELGNNEYKFFDIDSRNYTTGEIVSGTGEGVSIWESHNENKEVNTCLIYEYHNGKRRYTPGCSFF